MGNKVSYKSHTKLSQALSYLEEIIKLLKEGKACIQHDREYVTLTPAENVTLEVGASAKKGKESLAFELKWRQGSDSEDDSELKISAEEPEMKEPENHLENNNDTAE
ncbi:amphi-Trp domain-containing protein [bacterium]|nr:amphi-Trp domain-containing protein [bacterium]